MDIFIAKFINLEENPQSNDASKLFLSKLRNPNNNATLNPNIYYLLIKLDKIFGQIIIE